MTSDVSVVVSVALADQKSQHDLGAIGPTSTDSEVVLTQTRDQQQQQQHINMQQQLQQQHFSQPLIVDNNQSQVETTLADLVSGVVAQTPVQQQQDGTTQSTASNPTIPPADDVPWAWQFALAGVAASSDGESTSTAQNPNIGFVHTLHDAYDVMRSYELHTMSKFAQVRTVQDFAKDLDCLKYKHRVRFEERKSKNDVSNKLPLRDTPFLLLGTKWFECQHGTDYHVHLKRKRNEAIENGDIIVKRRNKATKTKKVGCPAKIWMKDILVFPKKKLRTDVKSGKKMLSKEIRAGTVKGERRIYVSLPDPSLHSNHAVGEASGMDQRVDPQVIDKIYWLVNQGINSTRDVQLHLEKFVREELFSFRTPPLATNRRFFPTKKDIRNHIVAARRGRLPPKERAKIIAKQSNSSANMCASNKLAYPKTNETAKCRALAKQIMHLSKRIGKNPNILAGATKKMEDLVIYLRVGAQKEQKAQRTAKKARESSLLQSTALERPPQRKRPRGKRGNVAQEGQDKAVTQSDNGATFHNIPETSADDVNSNTGRITTGVVEDNQGQSQQIQHSCKQVVSDRVEIQSLEGPSQQIQQSQFELGDQARDHHQPPQHISFQPQAAQELVKLSLQPLPSTTFPIEILHTQGQTSPVTPEGHVILQKILQGSGHQHVTVLPQGQYQAVQVNSENMESNSEDSSSATRALIQLNAYRAADLQQGTAAFLTTPLQFHTSPNVVAVPTSIHYTPPSS